MSTIAPCIPLARIVINASISTCTSLLRALAKGANRDKVFDRDVEVHSPQRESVPPVNEVGTRCLLPTSEPGCVKQGTGN